MSKIVKMHTAPHTPFRKGFKEPGRNDPCPCKSGKKYKHCCLGKVTRNITAACVEASRVNAGYAPMQKPAGS